MRRRDFSFLCIGSFAPPTQELAFKATTFTNYPCKFRTIISLFWTFYILPLFSTSIQAMFCLWFLRILMYLCTWVAMHRGPFDMKSNPVKDINPSHDISNLELGIRRCFVYLASKGPTNFDFLHFLYSSFILIYVT